MIKHIDSDVAGAARRYLRANPGGALPFSEFLNLLVAEIRDQVKDDFKNRPLMKERLLEIVGERLEREVVSMIPVLRGRLQDHLTMQVVILEKSHKLQGHLLVKTEPFWKALAVRGEMGHSLGLSPKEAWTEMRKQIACKLFGSSPEDLARQLSIRDFELAKRFEAGKPYWTDHIEGFKGEVRLIEKEPKPEA